MRSTLLASAAALATTTCCPSLMLTVEQVKTSPRPWLPAARAERNEPIPEPAEIENRVVRTQLPLSPDPYRDYTDTDTQNPDTLNPEQTRSALAALTRIKHERKSYETWSTGSESAGTVRCGDDPKLVRCRFIEISSPAPATEVQLTTPTPSLWQIWQIATAARGGEALAPGLFLPIVQLLRNGQVEWRLARCVDGMDSDRPTLRACQLFGADRRLVLFDPIEHASDGEPVKLRFYNDADELPRAKTLASFVHLTDVQFRDPTVFVGGEALSHQLDWLIQSFEYDPELEFDDVPLTEALVATINAAVKPDASDLETMRSSPTFVIHTGDAIDTGVTSELATFHRVLDGLVVPWYDTLGSHDVMAFGNLMPTRDRKHDDTCATVVSVAAGEVATMNEHKPWFRALLPGKLCIDAHIRCKDCGADRIHFVSAGDDGSGPITHAGARRHFIAGLKHEDGQYVVQPHGPNRPADQRAGAPDPSPRAGIQPICEQLTPYRPSWNHGFDLYPNDDPPGYYVFTSYLGELSDANHEPHRLVSIVLNQEDLSDRGEVQAGVRGRMGNAQLSWLTGVLGCTTRSDLVLVFGHVPLSELDQAHELEQILASHNDKLSNVIAYFYGHHHSHAICGDHKRKTACGKFWEVETASLLEFPQEARRVRIKYVGDGLAFLELVAFRERLRKVDERSAAIDRARLAAQRDACTTTEGIRCTKDQRVIRSDGHDANVRLWFRVPWSAVRDPDRP